MNESPMPVELMKLCEGISSKNSLSMTPLIHDSSSSKNDSDIEYLDQINKLENDLVKNSNIQDFSANDDIKTKDCNEKRKNTQENRKFLFKKKFSDSLLISPATKRACNRNPFQSNLLSKEKSMSKINLSQRILQEDADSLKNQIDFNKLSKIDDINDEENDIVVVKPINNNFRKTHSNKDIFTLKSTENIFSNKSTTTNKNFFFDGLGGRKKVFEKDNTPSVTSKNSKINNLTRLKVTR
jgi:hypothetical protein